MMLTLCSIKKCAAQSLYCPNVTLCLSLTRRMETTAVCFMLCWKLHSTKDLTASSPAVLVGFERRIGYGSSHHNTYNTDSPLTSHSHENTKSDKQTHTHAHIGMTLFSAQY